MRNCNPFTNRQLNFIKALSNKISKIDDPDPEIITDESYHWRIEQTKQFGKIPKIKFHPNSCRIKAEIIRESGLIDDDRNNKLSGIRVKYGIKKSKYSKARLFEAELNNIMLKIKKAVYTVGHVNFLFTASGSQISDPLALLQQIVMEEQSRAFGDRKTARKNKNH